MIEAMLDLETCFENLRAIRWDKDGVCCPRCSSYDISPHGFANGNIHQRRYKCKGCKISFNDLTNTVIANSRIPLHLWLSVYEATQRGDSLEQISQALNVDSRTARDMVWQLREGIECPDPYKADW